MTTKKQKILIVDDDEFIRIYFKDVLWIHGMAKKFDIETASTNEAAQKIIDDADSRPDIIFLDLTGPMMVDGQMLTTVESGFSLLKKIKEGADTKNIKVVMYTGHSDQEYKDRAAELKADGYLIKGENMPGELVKFIEKLI